jgi:hypothetical protein
MRQLCTVSRTSRADDRHWRELRVLTESTPCYFSRGVHFGHPVSMMQSISLGCGCEQTRCRCSSRSGFRQCGATIHTTHPDCLGSPGKFLCFAYRTRHSRSRGSRHPDAGRAMVRHGAKNDPDGTLAFYSDDAVLLPPNAPMANDQKSIRESWAGLLGPNTAASWKVSRLRWRNLVRSGISTVPINARSRIRKAVWRLMILSFRGFGSFPRVLFSTHGCVGPHLGCI